MAAGAFKDSWAKLGETAATQVLSAGSAVAYIGPALALVGLAIQQWSACREVPKQAVDLLQSCRDLVDDVNQAWRYINDSSDSHKQQRLQGWLARLAEAAAYCCKLHTRAAMSR
jgi:hypothetical protein